MKSTRNTTAMRREARRETVRYLHISCNAYMVPNPLHTLESPMPPDMRWLPKIEKPGRTYNVRRNKAKREKRAWWAAA